MLDFFAAFLSTIILVIYAYLDHVFKEKEQEHNQWAAKTRKWLPLILIFLAVVSGFVQYFKSRADSQDVARLNRQLDSALTISRSIDRDMERANHQLDATTSSLSNALTISSAMQADIQRFRKQSDIDQIALSKSFLGVFVASPADRQFAIGQFAFQTGRREEAKTHFKMAIALNPAYSAAHNNLAILLREDGQKQAADEHVRLAYESDTNSVVAAANYASILMTSNQMEKAIQIIAAADGPLDDIDPPLALALACELASGHNAKFLRFLARYVQFSESPKAFDLYPALSLGLTLLAWNDRASLTNWYPLFSVSERVQFERELESCKQPYHLADQEGEPELAEQHVNEMTPQYASEWANELAKRLNPKFLKFLTFYVESSHPPSVWNINMSLHDGWRCLSSDEKASVTNWFPLLSPNDRWEFQRDLDICNSGLARFQEQDRQAQLVENHINDIDPQTALQWAKDLAWWPRNPRFLNFLNRYVQASPSPSHSELMQPLHFGWQYLTKDQKASITNWYPRLKPEDRDWFQQVFPIPQHVAPTSVAK